ncbi:hypothetical protein, partial [Catelliglobosispora koreensis]|uniref:hypothetical protein n=1 Tax=Catelliglobosispora koreensis TaxID=129052 RepID=UPI000475841B
MSFPVSGVLADKDGGPVPDADLAAFLDPSPAMLAGKQPAESIPLAAVRTNAKGEFQLTIPALKGIGRYLDRKGLITLQFMSFGEQHDLVYQLQVKLPTIVGKPARAAIADSRVFSAGTSPRVVQVSDEGTAIEGMKLTATKRSVAAPAFGTQSFSEREECLKTVGSPQLYQWFWVQEGSAVKKWVPVQRSQTGNRTKLQYQWSNTNETSVEVGIKLEYSGATVTGGFSQTLVNASGIDFSTGHNVVRDLEAQYDFYFHRLRCTRLGGGGTDAQVTKLLPHTFTGGNRNTTYTGYYGCAEQYRTEISNPTWVSKASTTTISGSLELNGAKLAAVQKNTSAHKKTYIPVTTPAGLCGENGNPADTERVGEVWTASGGGGTPGDGGDDDDGISQPGVAVPSGMVYQLWGDTAGWHSGNTDNSVNGVSAVNMGGQWPQALAIKNGVVHQIWGDTSGWHIGSTGLPTDAVSAVNMGGTHPQGLALKNGVVHQIWADTS